MTKLRLVVDLEFNDWNNLNSTEKEQFLYMLKNPEENIWHNNEIGDTVGSVSLVELKQEDIVTDGDLQKYDLYVVETNVVKEPYIAILAQSTEDYLEIFSLLEPMDFTCDLTKVDPNNVKKISTIDDLPSWDEWLDYVPYGPMTNFYNVSVIEFLQKKEHCENH